MADSNTATMTSERVIRTDMRRWNDTTQLQANWNERAEVVSNWIPSGVRVADIGCGAMAIEKLLKDCEYVPVDVVRRDERTTVVDLNSTSLPSHVLRKTDYVTLLGVLEYLEKPSKLLAQLYGAEVKVICSYQLADQISQSERDDNGWFNSFTAIQFAKLLRDSGFRIMDAKRFGQQGLYLLEPEVKNGMFSVLRSIVRRDADASLPSASSEVERPRLVLSGFFGRGNVGDEAMLQVQYETLSPHFDITISVERVGAYDGFWNWYPYNSCEIIHHPDIGYFQRADVVGLHVGGGDLPVGFNGGQVLATLAAGKPVLSTGVEFGAEFMRGMDQNPEVTQEYCRWLSPWYRSAESYRLASERTQVGNHGADWALHLPTDDAEGLPKGDVALVLREFPVNRITPNTRATLTRLIDSILENYGNVFLLPFCPEDERFLDHLEATWGLRREVHWWNPRRVKQIIAQSRRVISIGRFHPLVFAGSTHVPATFAEWDEKLANGCETNKYLCETSKARRLCDEANIPYFRSIDALISQLRPNATELTPTFDGGYSARFQAMVQHVVNHFGAPVRA